MELVVGRVIKPHGVRGELVVEVRTDEPDLRFAPGSVLRVRPRMRDTTPYSELPRFTLQGSRPHSGRLLVTVEGVDGREAADALRGSLWVVDSAELPPREDPDAFYDHELEGLEVRLRAGSDNPPRTIGIVREVIHAPGGDLLSVDLPEAAEVLVPFVSDIVPVVDPAEGYVEIDPPEGLLPEGYQP